MVKRIANLLRRAKRWVSTKFHVTILSSIVPDRHQSKSSQPELAAIVSNETTSDLSQSSENSADGEAPDNHVNSPSDDRWVEETLNEYVQPNKPENSSDNFPPTDEEFQEFLPKEDSHPKIKVQNNKAINGKKLKGKTKASRKPRDISGRRNRKQQKPKISLLKTPRFRPELVCRKVPGSGTWEVVLITDKSTPIEEVYLEHEYLSHKNQICRLPSLKGNLTVLCKNGQTHNFSLFYETPLIFKFRKNWIGEGREISRITNGYFIVIVPNTWKRSRSAPVEPDYCTDTNFRAHYFYKDASSLDKDIDGFRECVSFNVASGIKLTGKHVFDNSEDGTLFVNYAPELVVPPTIRWAKVGEEKTSGWVGESFEPDKQSLSEVLNCREGHFFLRVYDSDVKLVDSTEFRYLRNLEQICVNDEQYTQDTVLEPQSSGYPNVGVRFIDADDKTITSVKLYETAGVSMCSGVLDVSPHPEAGRVSCTLESGSGSVQIVLELFRIWWRMEDERNTNLDRWFDTPLVMTREEFRSHARYYNAKMIVLSKQIQLIHVGFDDEKGLKYRRATTEDRIEIPLIEFYDCKQITQRHSSEVHLNAKVAEKTFSLIKISPDPMPSIVSFTVEPTTITVGQKATLRWITRNTEHARIVISPEVDIGDYDDFCTILPTETTEFTLTLSAPGIDNIKKTVNINVGTSPTVDGQPNVNVKCTSYGWRRGKGFSLRELREAGLTEGYATSCYIPIDKRRRSSHITNVEEIRRTLDA